MIKDFKSFLLLEFDTNKKPKKKIYDILKKEPSEKKSSDITKSQYKGLKEELLIHIHKQNMYKIKELLRTHPNLPEDIKNELRAKLVPLSEITDAQNEEYASELASLYSLFKKYVELKRTITHKEENQETQSLPLGTIKNLISQGKSLGEIADYFKIPKSTLSYKIGELYQTSYSKLKKQMNK